MLANKRLHKDTVRFSQRTHEDQFRVFFAWLPAELLDAPGIDWTRLPSQVAGYLVRSVGTSPDAAYLAMAAASALDAISPASLLSMLWSLHSLLRFLRTVFEVEDSADLPSEHNFVARTSTLEVHSGQIKAYSSVTRKHFPAYLERLNAEERQRMSRYALPLLPEDFLKHMGTTRPPEERHSLRELHKQQKAQLARAYIKERCSENPDVTCRELCEGLRSLGIRMGNKGVNSIRGELGLKRPSGSVAQHLHQSRVHAQARDWLVKERRQNPYAGVDKLQAGLLERFGINIGARQLNNILRELGVARPGPHSSKANQKTSAPNVDTPAQPGNQIEEREREAELQIGQTDATAGKSYSREDECMSSSEEQLRSFFAWLPQDLHNAPGIDWSHLPDTVMGYCIRSASTSPDAPYLAAAAAAAHGRVSPASLLQLLRQLHAFFATMRAVCGMECVSDLRGDLLWNEFAARTQKTRSRSVQLSSYSAVSAKHYPQYLLTLEAGDYFLMQQYQLPPMPPGFLKVVGRANELNRNSWMGKQPIRKTLVPLFPSLCQLVWLRKQLAERMLRAFRHAQSQAAAGAGLPLGFQYTDFLPELSQTGELRGRELTLRFTLWNRRSWILHHQERYSERLIRDADKARGIYSADRDLHFVQFGGDARDLLWFGDLIEQQLLQHLHDEPRHDPAYAKRVRLAQALGFPHGCATSRSGLLQAAARWFAEHTRPGELLFEPEALYRGILYGAALATLAMTNGGEVSELLQVSADHWVTTPVGRHQKLLPARAKTDHERHLFTISAEAAQLLEEIEQGLVEAYTEIPVAPASRQITKFDQLRPERYFFQWQRGMVDPHDTETLVRFLLHGVSLVAHDNQAIRFSMELLRGGNTSLQERSQTLLHALGFNQDLLSHLSPASADVYCRDLFAYWQFAGSREAALQPLTLARWMVHMGEEHYDVSTINRIAREIRRIFAAAAAAGHIDRSLADAFQ